MKQRALALAVLCCLPALALAQNCNSATTTIDHAICSSTLLKHLDSELNRLYRELRPKLTVPARARLLAQQRNWLTERDRACSSAAIDCLQVQYQARLRQLIALTASADTSEDLLDDVTPVVLTGLWNVVSIHDAADATNTGDLAPSLEMAKLPEVGAVVVATPGKLCIPHGYCGTLGWSREQVQASDHAEAVSHALGLKPSDTLLEGSTESRYIHFELTPRADGTLWAIFGLCSKDLDHCHLVGEVWPPATPDAVLLIGQS